jgi:plasmid stabilization system protein ParE
VEKVRAVKLWFTPRALRQFSLIAEFSARDDPTAARRVGERIQSLCGLLTEVPGMGRTGALAGTREMSVPGLPYVIVHRLTAEEIIVLGIYHHRQLRPGQTRL